MKTKTEGEGKGDGKEKRAEMEIYTGWYVIYGREETKQILPLLRDKRKM